MRPILAALLCLALAPAAHAACEGTDLRETLSTTERARLDAELDAMPYANGNH